VWEDYEEYGEGQADEEGEEETLENTEAALVNFWGLF
jgi:hypothetical protein